VTELSNVLEVSVSGYYGWRNRPKSQREERDQELSDKIMEIYNTSRSSYGSPRIHAMLQRNGEQVGRKRVIRLMQANNLRAKGKRKYKATRDSRHHLAVSPNLLKQDFRAYEPNKIWAGDIS